MKILFITSKHLGDAIISSAVMECFHQRCPEAKFTVVCGQLPAPIFTAPYIGKVIPIGKRKRRMHWWNIWKSCAFEVWDCVIDMRGSFLSYVVPSFRRYVWRAQKDDIPKVNQMARFLNVPRLPLPKVYTTVDARKKVASLLKGKTKVIAFGATASWAAKCWSSAKFIELAQQMKKDMFSDAVFAVLGGPQDIDTCREMCKQAPKDLLWPMAGCMDVATTAAFLEKCTLFIGNDSGLMHLAAAVGTPTLGLFGPSKESIYQPQGKICHWVRTEKSYEELICVPEYDWKKPGDLMEGLSVQKALDGVKKLFSLCQSFSMEKGIS